LTTDPALDAFPVWTADGRRIVFASQRSGPNNLFWQPADGTGTVERLTTTNGQSPTAISADGTLIVQESGTLRALQLGPTTEGGTSQRTKPLGQAPLKGARGALSPDGRWLAYESSESGHVQVYVRPFPNVDSGHWQISTSGGSQPAWARSGRELFYLDGSNAVTAVLVHTSPSFGPGLPKKLFDGRYVALGSGRTYDIALDDQRFLMIKDTVPDNQSASLVVVLNWPEELKRLVPAK
jgi:Tol biopolymer transport system component